MSGARGDILSAIRAAAAGRPPAAPVTDHLRPARAAGDAAALRARFAGQAAFAGAVVSDAAGPDGIVAAVARALADAPAGAAVSVAADGGLDALPWPDAGPLRFRVGPPAPSDRATVTAAVAGIAETGTVLVRCGGPVANAAHLLGETHVVVLPAGRIVGGYEQGWALLREALPGALPPRAATFVTGPSRTADIEKTPQIGVHGPRRLHIVLVDGEAP